MSRRSCWRSRSTANSFTGKRCRCQPGLYRLDIAIKDVNNPDHIGIYGRGIEVPTYQDEKLGASSLILADQMNTVSSRQIGSGNFIISNTFVRPRVIVEHSHAGELQAQPGPELLDAVLQPSASTRPPRVIRPRLPTRSPMPRQGR